MTDTMTPGEALEILKRWARHDGYYCVNHRDKDAALAVLREHHAHFSRFKPGDTVWYIFHDGNEWRLGGRYAHFYDESKLFPTEVAAQAEAAKRNQEKP